MNRTDCPEFPHLAKEVQPLLGLFSNGVYTSVPLQVLRDVVHMNLNNSTIQCCSWWGVGGIPPEVHNHLPCFERVKLVFWMLVYREKSIGESTHPWGAPVLIVRVLDVSLSSLTSWWSTDRLGRARRAGSVCLREGQAWWYWRSNWSPHIRSLHNSQGCRGVAGCNAVPCWLPRPN